MKTFSLVLCLVGAALALPGKKSFVDPWPAAPAVDLWPVAPAVSVSATTCSTVMDEVWEEKCKTIYNDVCVTDSVQDCQVLNGKMCSTVFDDVCTLVPKTQ